MFEATEVINPAINHEGVSSPFPFLQSDLYNVTQPGTSPVAFTFFGMLDGLADRELRLPTDHQDLSLSSDLTHASS